MKKGLLGLLLFFLFVGCATVPRDSQKELVQYIPTGAHILFSLNAKDNQSFIKEIVKRVNLTDKRISMLIGMVEYVLLGLSDPGDGSMAITVAITGSFPSSIIQSTLAKQKQLTQPEPGLFVTHDEKLSVKIEKPYLIVVNIAGGGFLEKGISPDAIPLDHDFSVAISDFNKIVGLGEEEGSSVKIPIQSLSLSSNRLPDGRYSIQCQIHFQDARSARLFRGLLKGVVSNFLISYAGDVGRGASREMKFSNIENTVQMTSLNLEERALSSVLISILIKFKGKI